MFKSQEFEILNPDPSTATDNFNLLTQSFIHSASLPCVSALCQICRAQRMEMKETGALPSSSLHSSVGDKPVNQTQYSTADANEGACGAWETGEGFPEETLLELGL